MLANMYVLFEVEILLRSMLDHFAESRDMDEHAREEKKKEKCLRAISIW